MKITVIFSRHGQTDLNKDGKIAGSYEAMLTEKGIQQAKELGENLKDVKITAAFVSPLKRAIDTFNNAFPNPNFPFEIDDLLAERNFGSLEGRKNDENHDYYGAWRIEYQSKMDGETIADVAKRWDDFIEKIKKAYAQNTEDVTILVVAHGGLGCVARAYFEGEPADGNYLSIPPIPNGSYAKWTINI